MRDPTEVSLAEYKALRDELLGIRQIQTAVLTAALTILAAVGGVALTKKGGRVEILLVLPFVLSGLGVIIIQCAAGVTLIGDYIRTELWTGITVNASARLPSWEVFLEEVRCDARKRYRFSVIIAPLLILAAPSWASLGITYRDAVNHLWPLWWGGVLAVGLSGAVAVLTPREKKRKRAQEEAPRR